MKLTKTQLRQIIREEIQQMIEEREGQTYIVFMPIEDNKIDTSHGSFGIYTSNEYDVTRKPYKKWPNYTTSNTFDNLKAAKAHEKLVIQSKGDMDSPIFKKAQRLK